MVIVTGAPHGYPIVYLYCIAVSAVLLYYRASSLPLTGVCKSDTICGNPAR